MKSNFSTLLSKAVFRTAVLAVSATALSAHAGSWGLLVSHMNPAGSNLGINLLYQGQGTWGFETGIGGLYGQSSESAKSLSAWGDVDLKLFMGNGPWRGFFEGGLAFGLGAGSGGAGLAAGSPFAGVGLLYYGSTMLFHVTGDYKFNTGSAYPAFGLGLRL